jgi:hypothetical protein
MSRQWPLAVCSPAFAYSPRCAAGYSAQSGLGTGGAAWSNSKNEKLFFDFIPVIYRTMLFEKCNQINPEHLNPPNPGSCIILVKNIFDMCLCVN